MFHAQHNEDRWLEANWTRLRLPTHGVFVDVGASEGVIESNTVWLERERGWTGICIDADPRVIETLRRNRKCTVINCAVGPLGIRLFPLHPNQKLSGFLREEGPDIAVVTMPLDSLVATLSHLDILSIDTEGTELDVLATIDLDRWQPSLIFLEWDTIGLPDRREEIIPALQGMGYSLLTTLGANLVFERNV
jgi:FkbM family methyltransferase